MSNPKFEYVGYLSCTAMNADGAKHFFGGEFFKVISMGQADPKRFKFGARHYRLFRTKADWKKYQSEQETVEG